MSKCFAVFALLLGLHSTLSAKELRVAASAYLSEPYTIYEKGELRGGLIKDIFSLLGDELGVVIKYVDCPRKRVEQGLVSGDLHIAPVAHPLWLSKNFAGDWTDPLFELRELLILRTDSQLKYHGPEDLKGLRIGTILGYHYPIMDAYFKSKDVTRSDVQRADQNADMLLNHRIDAYIVHDIVFRYFQKVDARAQLLRAVELGTTVREISWAVSRKTPVPLKQLNAFVRDLKKSGRLEAILKKYRPLESAGP